MEEAKRFNQGKLRVDLIPPSLINGVAEVLQFGAAKYGDDNWKKGMKWSKCMASFDRHWLKFKQGEDFDRETGLLHLKHCATNISFLLDYYNIAPQFDDRPHLTKKIFRIGLDIDDVCANFVKPWCKLHDLKVPSSWNFMWNIGEEFQKMRDNNTLDDFYLNLPRKFNPLKLQFVPTCYITHRPVDKIVTETWLSENDFPLVPVFNVSKREEKLEVAREMKLDIFIDDNYDQFCYFNRNGIACYLMDAKHNHRHEVGYRRIKNLTKFNI